MCLTIWLSEPVLTLEQRGVQISENALLIVGVHKYMIFLENSVLYA